VLEDVEQLEDRLTRPSDRLIALFNRLEGDILVIGAGGKMGPTLTRLAARAIDASGIKRSLTAVSTFSQPGLRERLERAGVRTIVADILDPGSVERLPDAANVVHMIGRKFGSTGAEWNTWATNVYAAGLVGERFRESRIVAFSSGNVYPFVPVNSGGATEATPPGPVGEYAITALGRERMFDYASHERGARVLHFRLNYAVEMRYGVLVDVAQRVWRGIPVDLTMGHANVIWQGYANAVALQCFELATRPPAILNVTGIETLSIRNVAARFGAIMHKTPILLGQEAPNALLSNATRCHERFGPPEFDSDSLIEYTARWVMRGLPTLDKPTHFEVRDGKF
jgi:hypothetical protein